MPKKKKAVDATLPGMEDHAIPELEQIAQNYAAIRDQRIELNQEEATLKSAAIAAMKKHTRTVYHHGGVTITVVAGEEDLKVKIAKPKVEEDPEVAFG